MGLEVALSDQLLERRLDQSARDPEVRGHRPRGRHPLPRCEPTGANRRTELTLELGSERLVGTAVELDEHLRTPSGPLNCHDSGP